VAANRQRREREEGIEAGSGSLRQCAVTRAILDPDQLIRFVQSPGGEIVPDLERRLPGRGVWLTCDKETVKKAIISKAFCRVLKSQVTVLPDLIETIDSLLLRRTIDALALANKAGRVVTGFQQVDSALEKGEARAVLHGSDASPDGSLKLDRKFRAIQRDCGEDAAVVAILTITEMSLAMGKSNVVHAALISGGLSERFLREAGRLARYRASPAASEQAFFDFKNEG
jgi:uncharacterized protein